MITYRCAKSSDLKWAYAIKSDAEFHFVSEHFGWDSGFQETLHEQEWTRTRPTIIEYNGNRVGFFSIENEDGKDFFRRFFISREYRNLGIGSEVVEDLISRYKVINKTLWLAVFIGNPAKQLYLRFGFKEVRATDKYEYMCYVAEPM